MSGAGDERLPDPVSFFESIPAQRSVILWPDERETL
jgi:hypothetical protein